MEFELTKNQKLCFDAIEKTNLNYLLMGKPGVGKSVLINTLTSIGRKDYTLAAPTGLAAINISGKTLHSLFGIPVSGGVIAPDFNKFTENENIINNIRFSLKHLIIDEISMVRCDILDYIERFIRHVKGNQEPFGGVQVIAVGDFYQLPPVVNSEDRKQLKQYGWESEFAFDAKCFKGFSVLQLNEVLRQKGDNSFIKILHEAREGTMTGSSMVKINDRVDSNGRDMRLKLVSTNAQADTINKSELAKIMEPEYEFHADSFGVWPQFPLETVLVLKVGAQVIIKKNGADRPPSTRGKFDSKVVNGTLAKVVEIVEEVPNVSPACIRVELKDGTIVPIYRARFERKVKQKEGNEWVEKVLASFEQMPISLAWAISMHKSQGQTFDQIHIDPARIFAAGQLYVAMSRARSLNGITLERRVSRDKFFANKRVAEFNSNL